MKTNIVVLVAAFLLVPLTASAADSPLHGIWRVSPSSIQATHPHAFVIRDGIYACLSCKPAFSIPADGDFHQIPSGPGQDELAVLVMNDHQIQISARKNGHLVANTIRSVSDDGAVSEVTQADHSGDKSLVSTYRHQREGTLPADAHATSGSWRQADYKGISESGRAFTYSVNGNRLQMNNPQGHVFVARMDGTDFAYEGSHLVDTVAVTKMAPHRVRVVTRHEGQVVGITTLHVVPNGSMMRVVEEHPVDGSRISYVAERQDSISLAPVLLPDGGGTFGPCSTSGECVSR